jgi:predicted adenine nucleotide alpha hydrolase (AANH) superfamily ATPase
MYPYKKTNNLLTCNRFVFNRMVFSKWKNRLKFEKGLHAMAEQALHFWAQNLSYKVSVSQVASCIDDKEFVHVSYAGCGYPVQLTKPEAPGRRRKTGIPREKPSMHRRVSTTSFRFQTEGSHPTLVPRL